METRGSTRRHQLVVSPLAFALSWWLVAALHALNGLLALVVAAVYLYFGRSSAYATISRLRVPQYVLQLSGWSFLGVAFLHGDALLRLTARSLRARRFTFRPATHNVVHIHPSDPPTMAAPPKRDRFKYINPMHWWRLMSRFWARWWGVDGRFGLNGDHFRAAFLVREAVEVALQTYQADQLSRSVARTSINTLAVTTVVLNCLSSPIVLYVFRKQEAASRFVSLMADMVLDICTAVVIPLTVVFPYVSAYDPKTGKLPVELTADDVWFMCMTEEVRQFCVTSIIDYFASLMPHVSVYGCLKIAQSMIQCDPRLKRQITIEFTSIPAIVEQPNEAKPVVVARFASLRRRSFHLVVGLAWSVAVVAIHVGSLRRSHVSSSDLACILPVNPWLSVKRSCVVVQVNCHRDGTRGSARDLAAFLEPYDRSSLKQLIISHCEELEVPPILHEFHELNTLSIYNATLVEWSREAAITRKSLPQFDRLDLLRVRIATVMDGIYHADLPASFRRFTVAKSNLSALPSDIGVLWQSSKLEVFSIQHTEMQSLPPSFNRLQIICLELISNGIKDLHEAFLMTPTSAMSELHVSGNPVSIFPSTLPFTNTLTTLLVEDTNIATLPGQALEWLRAPTRRSMKRSVSFSGSPVCTTSDLAQDIRDVICGSRKGDADGSPRWNLIDQHRALT